MTDNISPAQTDSRELDPETQKWFDSVEYVFEYVLKHEKSERAELLLDKLTSHLRNTSIALPANIRTPYVNTLASDKEEPYPGDRQIERRIKSWVRWNAMAMVVKANRLHDGLGGHISTYASCATLYEVGFNHFFRGGDDPDRPKDFVYFQGHASPGNYARAFLERRLDAHHLHHFRQELAPTGGLSSYPHPFLMPDFWQFPSVSMGLAPIMSIYQARFYRYLKARGFLKNHKQEPKIWCFVGDGETSEPETLGLINFAAREGLDNLIWVVNCNLQRLDGPVCGNHKIIQELEGLFRGAGWNAIKVIWGSDWDALLKKDKTGLLMKRMEEAVDGDYQKYSVEPGSYSRKHFFGKYPKLLELVSHLSDQEIHKLIRGGHDPQKVYNAYKAAVDHKGSPTVILAKTIKGYGLGEAGEGRNVTHQQKKMNEKELREFKKRFQIPLDDDDVVEAPFYRPSKDSLETKYLMERRKALGGFLPKREVKAASLNLPGKDFYQDFYKGSTGLEVSTTMAFVRVLTKILRNKEIGRNVVPIIPDEARTFGMDALFRQIGIYAPGGQKYEPVDRETLLFYQEAKDGQLLEEGICEAGSMSSFIAAGTAYANFGIPMIPFYVFYSMFGFQRVGDLIWAAADSRAKGFLLGATAGRTTLNGEGLQHQDGHSHLMASAFPTVYAYDPAYAYEVAVIIAEGLRRMYTKGEEIFYYITIYNENIEMPSMPQGVEEGILEGLYKFKEGARGKKLKVHLFGSGPILNKALMAQKILEGYGVSADVWSATSYKKLRSDALKARRWNMLHPTQKPRQCYLERVLEKETGTFVAVSDNMKMVSDQISPWVPGGLFSLGTDGFGRSDTRTNLRRFFEVDAESTVIGTLYALSQKGQIPASQVQKAIQDLKFDPEKASPFFV